MIPKPFPSRATTRLRHPWFWGWVAVLCLLLPWAWRQSDLTRRFAAFPTSLVLLDREGQLLDARLASDGQWRFPSLSDTLPYRYRQALIAYEDRRFAWHPGIDPLGIAGALASNLRPGRARRGGSTLTMQTVRMALGNPPRTWSEKAYEAWLALAVERRYSKAEILRMYASHAPFGGNTVGLEAASWRYFGRTPRSLSWGEACLLAVLPNQPSLLRPGRNAPTLLAKRNRLLVQLRDAHQLDSLEAALAMDEPLPQTAISPPRLGFALLQTLHETHPHTSLFASTLDGSLQRRLLAELQWAGASLRTQGVGNGAVVVLDNQNGAVVAYGANLPGSDSTIQAASMDLVQAKRSSGSILKPFLYETLFATGELFPWTLVPDVPTVYAGFLPENFDRTWSGAVPASQALALSLNAPAARLLVRAGIDRFHARLKTLGMQTLNRPASHYGLSLVLGGAETTVWDLAGMYGRLAMGSQTTKPSWSVPHILAGPPTTNNLSVFNPASAWWTLEALREVHRPQEDRYWQNFSSSRPLAWKTGTSHGHRDAWAVGTTPRWTVAVWVGNPNGTGMPAIVGREAAAPLLFRIVALLPLDGWFKRPGDGWKSMEVCPRSGRPAGPACPIREARLVPDVPLRLEPCSYHQVIQLAQGRRGHAGCSPSPLTAVTVFALPPDQDGLWRASHASEPAIPPWDPACGPADDDQLAIVYPNSGAHLFLPRGLDELPNPTVLRAAYRGNSRLFWHLDGRYLGTTERDHQMPAVLEAGTHQVTVVDEQGRSATRSFEVLPRE